MLAVSVPGQSAHAAHWRSTERAPRALPDPHGLARRTGRPASLQKCASGHRLSRQVARQVAAARAAMHGMLHAHQRAVMADWQLACGRFGPTRPRHARSAAATRRTRWRHPAGRCARSRRPRSNLKATATDPLSTRGGGAGGVGSEPRRLMGSERAHWHARAVGSPCCFRAQIVGLRLEGLRIAAP